MSNTYNLRSNKKALSSTGPKSGPKSGLKTGKSGPKSGLKTDKSAHKSRLKECMPPPLNLKPISEMKKSEVNVFEEALKNGPSFCRMPKLRNPKFEVLEEYKKKIVLDMDRVIYKLDNLEMSYVELGKTDYLNTLKKYLEEFGEFSSQEYVYANTKIFLFKHGF